MANIVYIIPGFTEKTSDKSYKKIISFFHKNNFNVVPIHISWKNNVMSNYLLQFEKQLIHKPGDKVYLFGFSFGAMIAFIESSKTRVHTQILCSLSPYFKEDIPYIRKSWYKIIGKTRINNFKNYSFNNLVKHVKCRTFLIVGEKEHILLKKRVETANKRILGSEIFYVHNARHNISTKEYTNILKELINQL